ncbi:hypothetical protein A2630_03380 [Candidatus Woesebacteria bacterium RIFCSPHIGHO2_01_FULL_44_10]|uniref:DUF86 domain-containing protein n=1 Tax=Candidatus Woesebacteria bacterium RIFCSPLOWO2_01_FULL_44_14 TaxID=1802525 RepID=A0A1F8BXL6_9BACT|nr:MAG: hypothetical protein A2630_03380 [Candidatus Woesebacteria bacterium RIFCSPHIGHO2_01_FULL_44_10]OGM56452.1 MAG: hypothetical protein A3F62_02040 [Candidatus Woesebacteria bacterium RIFCSPHIGHO2_12_FULL_44_11]OGM68854.1 MAG: hypothetical protein A2975_00585 [Candidatus Woesebacteria bacterium RIFCSPLOWO2_01_FULL_44_14]
MSKLPEEYLKHVLDEANYLLDSSKDISEEKFMHDETLQRAYARSIEVIGEAVKNLPNDFRLSHSEIDWKKITGMRDRLIHHYFGVDYEIVWDVVKNEIPTLKEQYRQF